MVKLGTQHNLTVGSVDFATFNQFIDLFEKHAIIFRRRGEWITRSHDGIPARIRVCVHARKLPRDGVGAADQPQMDVRLHAEAGVLPVGGEVEQQGVEGFVGIRLDILDCLFEKIG